MYQVVNNVEPQAATPAPQFGREKRVKHPGEVRRGDATTVIAHAQAHPAGVGWLRIDPDIPARATFKGMQHGVVDQVGNGLAQRSGVAVQGDIDFDVVVHHMAGFAQARGQRQNHLTHHFFEMENTPVQAGLINGHLLEARHQIGGVLQAAHEDARALPGTGHKLFELAAFEPRSHLGMEIAGMVLQRAGHREAVADRCV